MEQLYIWIIIAIVGITVDILTSNFFFVSFTCGAIGAIITIIFKGSLTNQTIVFALTSVVFMIVSFKISKRYLKKSVPQIPRQEETYVGRKITLEEDISSRSLMKLDGIYWTLINQGEFIKKGETAEIIGIEGNKLKIKKN